MTNHRLLRRTAGCALALSLLAAASDAVAVVTPTPVKVTPARELFPAPGRGGGHTYFAWTRTAGVDRYHAVVSTDGGRRVLMDPDGSDDAFTGSVSGGGVVLQVVRPDDSDLVRYDLAAGGTTRISHRTSDQRWQWRPTASGAWLMFGENRFDAPTAPWRVLLMNTMSGEVRILARSTNRCRCIVPGQVNGDYAVWTRGSRGDVFRYRISTGETIRLPNPSGTDHYAPSVSSDGTVFYVEAGHACGAAVGLLRYAPDGAVTQLFDMAPGREPVMTSALDDADHSVSLYYDRYECDTGEGDIFEISSADTASRATVRRVAAAAGRGDPRDLRALGAVPDR